MGFFTGWRITGRPVLKSQQADDRFLARIADALAQEPMRRLHSGPNSATAADASEATRARPPVCLRTCDSSWAVMDGRVFGSKFPHRTQERSASRSPVDAPKPISRARRVRLFRLLEAGVETTTATNGLRFNPQEPRQHRLTHPPAPSALASPCWDTAAADGIPSDTWPIAVARTRVPAQAVHGLACAPAGRR